MFICTLLRYVWKMVEVEREENEEKESGKLSCLDVEKVSWIEWKDL